MTFEHRVLLLAPKQGNHRDTADAIIRSAERYGPGRLFDRNRLNANNIDEAEALLEKKPTLIITTVSGSPDITTGIPERSDEYLTKVRTYCDQSERYVPFLLLAHFDVGSKTSKIDPVLEMIVEKYWPDIVFPHVRLIGSQQFRNNIIQQIARLYTEPDLYKDTTQVITPHYTKAVRATGHRGNHASGFFTFDNYTGQEASIGPLKR